jgi:hypothetical protein
MSEERIPLELNIKDRNGAVTPFSLEIIVRDGDIAGIEGRSGDDLVEGTLHLRRKNSIAEGGDQCWVCGRTGCQEVIPCP